MKSIVSIQKTRRRAALACVASLFAACGTSPQAKEPEAEAHASVAAVGRAAVVGTALDAATGKPIQGAVIVGFDAPSITTDAAGRFELRGLPVGAAGVVRATTEAGLVGENRIRPLNSGELEVVIYLRPSR